MRLRRRRPRLLRGGQRGLQTFEQDAADGQAAITLVRTLDHIPGRKIPAAEPQDLLTVAHELVVSLRLLPIQRADAPTVQRVILQRIEPGVHTLLGQMEPELEDQRALITEHPLQALRPRGGEFQLGTIDAPVHTILEHLAVPVAEENSGVALRRQASPETPCRWMRELFVAGHIEAVDTYQPRIHPLVEQLDGFPFAGTLDAIDQYEDREVRLGLEPVLRLQQRFTQLGHRRIVGLLVDGVTNFG